MKKPNANLNTKVRIIIANIALNFSAGQNKATLVPNWAPTTELINNIPANTISTDWCNYVKKYY